MKKNQFINLLLIIFALLILFTLKTVLFHYAIILNNMLGKVVQVQDIFNIYDLYFRKTIQLGDVYDKAPMIFDYLLKFSFEEVLFKFSILSILMLLLLKKNTFKLNFSTVKKNYLFYLLFIICACFSILYEPAPDSLFSFIIIKFYTNNEFTNIFQYFIFFIFLISIITYIFINILIIQENKIKNYIKVLSIIFLAYFMYYFFMSTWDFLFPSIKFASVGDQDMVNIFLCKSYGIPVADCMNAQPKPSIKSCLDYHKETKEICYIAMKQRNPEMTLQCRELLNLFNQNCKQVIAESK